MSTLELQRLASIVAALRESPRPIGDSSQDLKTIQPCLLEELYTVLEAIDNDSPADIEQALGQLLSTVLLMCHIGREKQYFTLDSVCNNIADRLRSQHPPFFSSTQSTPSIREEASPKPTRQPNQSQLSGISKSLPSLLRAHRIGQETAAIGFDWPDHRGVMEKVQEEISELNEAISEGNATSIRHELGDVLMALSSLGRHLKTPAEDALRTANDRFLRRFSMMKEIASGQQVELHTLSSEKLESLWQQAKTREG